MILFVPKAAWTVPYIPIPIPILFIDIGGIKNINFMFFVIMIVTFTLAAVVGLTIYNLFHKILMQKNQFDVWPFSDLLILGIMAW